MKKLNAIALFLQKIHGKFGKGNLTGVEIKPDSNVFLESEIQHFNELVKYGILPDFEELTDSIAINYPQLDPRSRILMPVTTNSDSLIKVVGSNSEKSKMLGFRIGGFWPIEWPAEIFKGIVQITEIGLIVSEPLAIASNLEFIEFKPEQTMYNLKPDMGYAAEYLR